MIEPGVHAVEIVKYDPTKPDTYPSVCHDSEEVKDRFGFEGGESLLFTPEGAYIGQIVKQLGVLGPEEG